MKTTIDSFDFKYEYYGVYTVLITVGNYRYSNKVTDMKLIDATKNADEPKFKDIMTLKKLVMCGSRTKLGY